MEENILSPGLSKRTSWVFNYGGYLIIVILACIPLFVSFPYRVNIFLSWEGAYRMSEGQIPFKDFGLPMGYMYWVIPSLFFKIFGPQLITLVKAQVFINILSGFAFHSILKSLGVHPRIRLLGVLIYCLSFSFINFWPWYNHTVIVYEMISLAFLMYYFFCAPQKISWVFVLLSAVFSFFSFFTKQDAGALGFLLCCALLFYRSIISKKWSGLVIYLLCFLGIGLMVIYPLTKYSFGYWFNHGQPPHTARVSLFEILDDFFYGSQWIKFYLFVIVLLTVVFAQSKRLSLKDERQIIFLLLTLGILAEATIIQVTSYTPPDGNIFFHSFAFVYIASQLVHLSLFRIENSKIFAVCGLGVLLWWSGSYWKYINRISEKLKPAESAITSKENMVNRKTYILDTDSSAIPQSKWVYSNLKYFKKIYMPRPTVEGINRVMSLDVLKKQNPRVLNMTELTPLAAEANFKLEAGPEYPLWYHLGVGMFNKQAEFFEKRIQNSYYDLVLYEYIPKLNNFYPFRVRDSLLVHYNKIDSFYAPRNPETKGMIEVYVPK